MPLQTHIRLPLSLRPHQYPACVGRGLRRAGPFSSSAFEAKPNFGPLTWIRRSRSGPGRLKREELLFSGGRCLGSFKDNAGSHIFPEGDQQLSRQGNDQYFPNSATIELYALIKPQGQYRTGLMPYPQPGELDHGCSQPRVSGFGDALFVSDGSAPPGRRRQSGIRGNLPSVGKASEQSLRPQDTSEFRTNPLQTL